ncbi:hypothetical protein KKD62_01470 [Patescibacteria group bacterium]|nr:hypothetical protein [Patescibacteria group bacterium]MBU1931392.1 hypothetical protein [Patescibacteria group bacterium]
MKKLIKLIWLAIKSFWQFGHLVIAIAIIAAIAYFLGYPYLQAIRGSDSFYHLTNVFWVNKFFPKLPYWYPLQNGGVVPIWGYPHLTYFLVVIIHRLTSLSLISAWQVLGWLSVPLTAFGLYLFVATRLKNQTMALIGSVLYLLAPITWVWLFDWGFYTESVSYIFVFPTLIFLDTFLVKKNWLGRLSLFLTLILLVLTFLAHPATFFVTVVIGAVLIFFQNLSIKPRSFSRIAGKSVLTPLLLLSATLLLLGFIIFDFYSYAGRVSPAPAKHDKAVFLEGYPTPVGSLLGLEIIPSTEFKVGHRNIVVPMAIWLPAIAGIVAGLIYAPKIFGLGLLAAWPVVFFRWPILSWYAHRYIPFIGYVINHRTILIFIRLLAPVVAAFGIWGVFKLLIDLPTFWIKKGWLLRFRQLITVVFTSIASIGLAGYLIVFLANKPDKLWQPTQVRYGPQAFDIRDPFFKIEDKEELAKLKPEETGKNFMAYLQDINNWPRPKLVEELDQPLTGFSDFIAQHKDEPFLRVDVSPFLGGVVQTLNLESEISQINLYAITLSLLEPYWGYEQQVFFSENTGNTINVNNLAQWFGIKYLFLSPQLDFIDKYAADTDHWQEIDEVGIWQFSQPTELYSWTVDKPVVLVIGSTEKAAFEPVFRASVNGAYNYADGLLVQGKANVDDYSLAELKQFDVLLLFGYNYKSQSKAYRLLDQYVAQGGNLFISTGWQYVDADWQLDKAPDFFPVTDLIWSTDYGAGEQLVLEDQAIGGQLQVADFAPLAWNDNAWGISIPVVGKRDWARTVLSISGKPLVAAGEYGEGKVIWTGLNIFGHLNTYDFNEAEMVFLGNLLRWFGAGSLAEEQAQSQKLLVTREHPDQVDFEFQATADQPSILYWREAEFPNWQATLSHPSGAKEKIDIYRAGPGFMLMRLPPLEQGSRLQLAFKPGGRTYLGRILSLFALIILLIYVVIGKRMTFVINRFLTLFRQRFKKRFSKLKQTFDNEEDY